MRPDTRAPRWFKDFIAVGTSATVDDLDRAIRRSKAQVVVVGYPAAARRIPTLFVFWRSDFEDLDVFPPGTRLDEVLRLGARVPADVASSRLAALHELPSAATDWSAVVLDRSGVPTAVALLGGHVDLSPRVSAKARGLPVEPKRAELPPGGLAQPEGRAAPGGASARTPPSGTRPQPRKHRAKGAARPTGRRPVAKNGGARRRARRPLGMRKKNGGRTRMKKPHRPQPKAATAAGRPRSRSPRDPPRSAYARIDGPSRVVVDDEFEVRIGLAAEQQSGVSEGKIVRPESSRGPYTLDVQVSADGFELRKGERWRNQLRVTATVPYPFFTIHLKALWSGSDLCAIRVKYAIDGQPVGFALRNVAVAATEPALPAKVPKQKAAAAALVVPTSVPVPDLTTTIRLSGQEGRLEWTFDVRKGIKASLPDSAVYTNIGDSPKAFADRVTANMAAREGQPGLFEFLFGSAHEVANQVPAEFWKLLRIVARGVRPQPPSVLVLTEEPHVPWELAVFEKPLLDRKAPPFLAAQVVIGRWVLDSGTNPRPAVPPPDRARAATMAVIHGDYPDSGAWRTLIDATEEARTLRKAWKATSIPADLKAVLTRLERPGADVIHFTCHGEFAPANTTDGLIMADGKSLAPEQIKALDLRKHSFVFLNACQVGRNRQSLGDYSGMAEAFLVAGASGVIAPLWSIKEDVSRDIAERFYQRVFAGGSPAAVLREERVRFVKKPPAESGTWMAFVYFGHPLMRLERPASK